MDKKKKKGASLFSGMNIKRKRKKKKTEKVKKAEEIPAELADLPKEQESQQRPDFGDSSDFTIAEDSVSKPSEPWGSLQNDLREDNSIPNQIDLAHTSAKKKKSKKGLNFALFKSGLRKKKKIKNEDLDNINKTIDFQNIETPQNEKKDSEINDPDFQNQNSSNLNQTKDTSQIQESNQEESKDEINQNSESQNIPENRKTESGNVVQSTEMNDSEQISNDQSDSLIKTENPEIQNISSEKVKKKKKKRKKKAFAFIKRKLKKNKKGKSEKSSEIIESQTTQNKPQTQNSKEESSLDESQNIADQDPPTVNVPQSDSQGDSTLYLKDLSHNTLPPQETPSAEKEDLNQIHYEQETQPNDSPVQHTQIDPQTVQINLTCDPQTIASPLDAKEGKSMSRLENEAESNLLEGSMNQTLENIRHNLEEGEAQGQDPNLVAAGQGLVNPSEGNISLQGNTQAQNSGIAPLQSESVDLLGMSNNIQAINRTPDQRPARNLILPTRDPSRHEPLTANPHSPSPELSTATQSSENSKLEKLVYKVSGDFRAKILREKNAKLWKKLDIFTISEISYLLQSQSRKVQRADRLSQLEKQRHTKEARIVECLEADLADEADQISAELENIQNQIDEIEAERASDDLRQETFLENVDSKLSEHTKNLRQVTKKIHADKISLQEKKVLFSEKSKMILEELTTQTESKIGSIDRKYSSLQSQLQTTLEDRSRLEKEKAEALAQEKDSLSRFENQEKILKEEIAALEDILADKNAKLTHIRQSKVQVLQDVRDKESRFSGLESEIKENFGILEAEIESVETQKVSEEGRRGRIEAEGQRAQVNLRKLQDIVDLYDRRLKQNSFAVESLRNIFIRTPSDQNALNSDPTNLTSRRELESRLQSLASLISKSRTQISEFESALTSTGSHLQDTISNITENDVLKKQFIKAKSFAKANTCVKASKALQTERTNLERQQSEITMQMDSQKNELRQFESQLAELEDGAGDILLAIKKQNVTVFRKSLAAMEIFENVFVSELFVENENQKDSKRNEINGIKERQVTLKSELEARVRALEEEIKLEDVDSFSAQGLRAVLDGWFGLKTLKQQISESEKTIERMFEKEEEDVGSAIELLESLKSESTRKSRQFKSTFNRTLKSLCKFLKATLTSNSTQPLDFQNISLGGASETDELIDTVKTQFVQILKSVSELVIHENCVEGKQEILAELKNQVRVILSELGEGKPSEKEGVLAPVLDTQQEQTQDQEEIENHKTDDQEPENAGDTGNTEISEHQEINILEKEMPQQNNEENPQNLETSDSINNIQDS